MIVEVRFEVADQDEPGYYKWQDAVDHIAAKGDGWRLPTKEELSFIYQQREAIGGFAPDWYWSSSEVDTYYAWYQNFSDGFQDYYGKFDVARVRAVRNE